MRRWVGEGSQRTSVARKLDSSLRDPPSFKALDWMDWEMDLDGLDCVRVLKRPLFINFFDVDVLYCGVR